MSDLVEVFEDFDVIVVGLGAHGSSAVSHLAKRSHGRKVLGLEKYVEVHDKGSSHGESRIIRQAYFEDPRYVPLLQRSLQLWRELQIESTGLEIKEKEILGEILFYQCGALMMGLPKSEVVGGTLLSAFSHQLPHQVLSSSEIMDIHPPFTPNPLEIGVFEEEGGYLVPELCIRAHQQLAKKFGADLRFDEEVISWTTSASSSKTTVITNRKIYRCSKLVLSVGGWAPKMYGQCLPQAQQLYLERRTQFWIEPKQENRQPISTESQVEEKLPSDHHFQKLPVFIWELGEGENFYGFPSRPGRTDVKVALHSTKQPLLSKALYADASVTPDTIDREGEGGELQRLREVLKTRIPALSEGEVLQSCTCVYTMTPDKHFLIDFMPGNESVLLVSPCSGHGFKFSSVVGEIVADLMYKGNTDHDIALFRIQL